MKADRKFLIISAAEFAALISFFGFVARAHQAMDKSGGDFSAWREAYWWAGVSFSLLLVLWVTAIVLFARINLSEASAHFSGAAALATSAPPFLLLVGYVLFFIVRAL